MTIMEHPRFCGLIDDLQETFDDEPGLFEEVLDMIEEMIF